MSLPGVRVLVADDQTTVREALRYYFSASGIEIVAEARDGLEAVRLAERHRPDVILMDIRMPRLDGIAAIRRITAREPAPSVIALTTFDLDDYLFGALQAGAVGFLLKDGDPALYIEAVRLAHQGHGLIDPQVTRRLIRRFATTSPRPPAPGLVELTPREHEALRQLARGLTNAEIAAELHIGEGTVRTHVAHILAKLGIATRVQAVIHAFRHGLVTPSDP